MCFADHIQEHLQITLHHLHPLQGLMLLILGRRL